MTYEEAYQLAWGNVERNVDFPENASPDEIYEEVHTLASDALADNNCPDEWQSKIATHIAMRFAQP